MATIEWVKSSHSGTDCVQWAPKAGAFGIVPVRDSKQPRGPVLRFSAASWIAFVDAVARDAMPVPACAGADGS